MDKFLKVALVLGAIDKASSVISNAVAKSNKELEKIGRSSRIQNSMNEIGDRAMLMGAAVTGFFGTTISAAEESEVATRRLDQVFRSMGDATGQASRAAAEYASQLSLQLGIEDEAILAAQAKLATFANVSNETARMAGIFDQATQAAFDLAAAGFGEAGSNAVQLGKALQDPIKGITALARSGVTFTAQEKKKIEQLVKSGQILKAQQMVLKAVQTQVGGTGAATATQTAKMRVSWGEVSETIGKILLPAANKITSWLANVVPKVQKFIENNEGLIKALAAGGVALLAFGVAMKVAAGVMAFFNAVAMANPVVLIIAAIAAAAALIISYWTEIKEFFVRLWDNIKAIFKRTWDWIKNLFLNYHPYGLIIKHWDKIKAWFSQLWENIKNVFRRTWDWIKNLFLNYHPYGLVIKHWDKIKAWFIGIWESVKSVFMGWVDWAMALGDKFLEAGRNIVNSIWRGIKEMAYKPVQAMEEMVGKMRDYLPFSPAKTGPFRDIHRVRIVETIADGMKPAALTNKMGKVMQATRQTIDANLRTSINPQVSPNASGGGSSQFNYAPVLTVNGGSPESEQNLRRILDDQRVEFQKLMRQENERRMRVAF